MTMTPDMINGLFETFGAVLVFNHCRVTLRDRAVKGVSIASSALFTLWSVWNTFYYPFLDQWFSFAGTCLLALANGLWVGLLIYFRDDVQGSLAAFSPVGQWFLEATRSARIRG
jgi:hypothetical protein